MSREYVDTEASEEEEDEFANIKVYRLEIFSRKLTLLFGILGLLFVFTHFSTFFLVLLFFFPYYIARHDYTLIDRERFIWWPQIFLPSITILISIFHILLLPLELIVSGMSLVYYFTSSPKQKPNNPLTNLLVGLFNTLGLIGITSLHFLLFIVTLALPLSLWQVTYWEIGTATMALIIPPAFVALLFYCTHLSVSGIVNIVDLKVGQFLADMEEERRIEKREKKREKSVFHDSSSDEEEEGVTGSSEDEDEEDEETTSSEEEDEFNLVDFVY